MAEQTTTQRKTAAKKAAATRKRNAAARKAKSAGGAARTTRASARTAAADATSAGSLSFDAVALRAERAVLIPVGAALVARDKVVETARSYGNRAGAEKQLRRFERRGTTARNSVRREVKRTRTRVERELRQRRSAVEGRVGDVRRIVPEVAVPADLRKQVSEVQANATELARKVQQQVAALA